MHHELDASEVQPYWDNSVAPRLVVAPGDSVTVECREATGEMTPDWTADDLVSSDLSLIHALTGSIAVEGAEPGDALLVEVVEMEHTGWGWTAQLPGFGLLTEEFPEPLLRHWEVDGEICRYPVGDIGVPYDPFPGVLGVAPAEDGRISTIPPRVNGGNIDVRDTGPGSTIVLPVLHEGALFAIGDCHAAQGDGEVCGTAIEAPMTVHLRLDLAKGKAPAELQISRSAARQPIEGAWHITTAHGPDLMDSTKRATRYMIDWLVDRYRLEPEDAYTLCSVAGDLRISEVVDAPNWIVSMHMPLAIFGD